MAEINVNIHLNAEEATKDLNTFSDSVNEKITELNELQAGIGSEGTWLNNYKKNFNPLFNFDSLQGGLDIANTTIEKMREGLSAISSMLGSNGIARDAVDSFSSIYHTITSSMQSYSKLLQRMSQDAFTRMPKLDQKAIERQFRLSSATGLRAAEDAKMLAQLFAGNMGVTPSQFSNMFVGMKSIADKEIKQTQRTLRNSGTLDDLTGALLKSQPFQELININASSVTTEQRRNIAKAMVLATNRLAANDQGRSLKRAGVESREIQFVTDVLPEAYREAYTTYGRTGNKAGKWFNNTNDERAYANFRNLVRSGNTQAVRLGQQVGLVKAQGGYYRFSSRPSEAQLGALATLAVRSIADAKTSLPYYAIGRNSIEDEDTLINRQNKVYEASMEIVDALSKAGIKPTDVPLRGQNRQLLTFYDGDKYNKNPVKIRTLGTANQFVIPKTVIGENGELVVRDPSWRKTNGVQEQKEDEFVTIGESAITQLLGMRGNNTYGYGRDKEGRAIYKAPKLLKIDTSGILEQRQNPETRKLENVIREDKQDLADRYNRLYNRKETIKYGDKNYIRAYANPTDGGLYMIEEGEYNRIVKEYADEGLANPFDNMDVTTPKDYAKAMKAIDVSRKKATPGINYKELGYTDKNGNARMPKFAMVDFETFGKYAGLKKDSFMRQMEMLDGAAIFQPDVLGFNAQMRAGSGAAKFMGQVEDWRKLLTGSKLLERAYGSDQHRGMITKNKGGGYSFYMPQIGLSEEEVKSYYDEMDRLQGIVDAGTASPQAMDRARKELSRIRETYFFDIMSDEWDALMTESAVKGQDKFRVLTKELFENQRKTASDKSIWAAPAKIRDDGTYELTARQQAEYFRKATEKGGLWVNRSAYDFSSEKDFIPESVATAIGISMAEREESNRNYEDAIHRLEKDDNARIEELMKTSRGRKLVEAGDIYGNQANTLIGSAIKTLERKKAGRHLYLPGRGLENSLTGFLPGSPWGYAMENLFGVQAAKGKYRSLFHYEGEEPTVLFNDLSDEEQNALSANIRAAMRLNIGRNPAAAGEYGVNVLNKGNLKYVQRALDAVGAEYDNTIYTDPTLQFQLMTGDYDGDTAWIARNLSSFTMKNMQRWKEQMTAARETIRKRYGETPESASKKANPEEQFTESLKNNANAQLIMGQTTAGMRNIIEGFDLDDPRSWQAMALLVDAYDRGTSEAMKLGEVVDLAPMAATAATQGAAFRRFVKEIYAYEDDSEKAHPNLFSTRLPNINGVEDLAALASTFAMRRKGENPGSVFAGSLDKWMAETYDLNSAEGRAAKAYSDIFKATETGYRLANNEDLFNLMEKGLDWGIDIDRRRKAGIDVEEESKRQASFIRRITQEREEGLTYDRNAERITELQDLIAKEKDSDVLAQLNTELIYRRILNEPITGSLKQANDLWDEEVRKRDKDVEDLIAKNMKAVGSSATDENNILRGRLSKVLKADPRSLAGMSWSAVSPWLYLEMQKDMATGNGFTLNGAESTNLLTGETGTLAGFTYGQGLRYDEQIEKRNMQMARELDRALGKEHILPETEATEATVLGNIRHTALFSYMKRRAAGQTANIADLLIQTIDEEINNGASDLRNLDLSVSRDETTGEYSISGKGANVAQQEKFNRALGVYNPATKKYEGGTLDAFVNKIVENELSAGGRIANAEGYNYGLNANGELVALNGSSVNKYGEKIDFSNITYSGENGADIVKKARFAPDLILANKNNEFTMYDYKSDANGARDALFQMMVYAKNIQNKGIEARDQGLNNGWEQYINPDGSLKFKKFSAFDVSSGATTSINFDQALIDKAYEYYQRGQKTKMSQAEDGTFMKIGHDILSEALGELVGNVEISQSKGYQASMEDIIHNPKFMSSANDSYRNFIAQKFAQDEETIDDVRKFAFQQTRRYQNVFDEGYSPFKYNRDRLNKSLDESTLTSMEKAVKESDMDADEKMSALLELERRRSMVSATREQLTRAEEAAVKNGFTDFDSYINQTIYGTKESNGLKIINAIRGKIANEAVLREGMLQNEDFYKNGNWVNDSIKAVYEESLNRQADAESKFAQLLPTIAENATKQNDAALSRLVPGKQQTTEEKVAEAYSKRIESIQQYIHQQDQYLSEFEKALEQTDKAGKPVLEEGSETRKTIESMKANAEENKKKAEAFLNDPKIKERIQIAAEQREALDTLQKDNRYNQLLRQSELTAANPFGLRKDFVSRVQAMDNQARTKLEQQRTQQQAQIYELENWQRDHEDERGTAGYEKNAAKLKDMKAALDQTNQGLTMLDHGGAVAAMAMAQFGQAIDRVVHRLGRQMFQKALQETKRFIQDFNRQMTSIQMITLKTDEQMSTLGDGLIAKAQELKVSISEITASAETLYRQGLSDQEVNERLEVISKFSKVSGTKIDAATKLVTVAMNTGLVTNPEVAADVVTALGDSAATNAAEIEKGIEKAGAAAAADGTTFAELASMLTAITSTTQVSGNIAGRTLNTIFGRMNKIGTNELIFDENGNAVSGSAVAKLLRNAGVETYSDGKKRSSYDVLYDLSQRWEDLDDATQQQIAAAIAGTRQYSNFAAIMTGMAEGKVGEYMALTGESGGIVDEKYEVYAKSLEAAITSVRNAWDDLVAGLTDSGALSEFANTIVDIINGVNKWSKSMGGLKAALAAALGLYAAYAAITAGIMSANPVGIAVGLATGAAAYGVFSALANKGKEQDKTFSNTISTYDDYVSKDTASISELKSLKEKGSSRTAEENGRYYELISVYSQKFGIVNEVANAAATGVNALTSSVETLGKKADDTAQQIIDRNEQDQKDSWAFLVNGTDKRNQMIQQISGSLISGAESYKNEVSFRNPLLASIWGIDEETGKAGLRPYASRNFIKARDNKQTRDLIESLFVGAGMQGYLSNWFEGFKSEDDWKEVLEDLNSNQLDKKYSGMLGQIMAYAMLGEGGDVDKMSEDWAMSAFSPVVTPLLERAGYDSGEIAYLLQEVVDQYLDASAEAVFGDPATYAQAYALNWLFGNEANWDSINNNIRTNLKGYGEKTLGQKAFNLEKLVGSDYYVDEDNNFVPLSTIDEIAKHSEYTDEARLAATLMQNYDRQKYQEFVRSNSDLLSGENLTDEDVEAILKNNGQELILGVNRTIDEYIQFYESGAKYSDELAKEIAERTKVLSNKFKAVSNKFVKAINYAGSGGWLEKNQAGVSADAVARMLLTGNYGSGAEGLTAFMRDVNLGNGIADWQTALKGNPEISRILNQMTYDTATASFVGGPADIMDQLYRAVAGGGLIYSGRPLNTAEKGSIASQAFGGLQEGWYLTDEERTRAMEKAWKALTDEDRRDTMMEEYFTGANAFAQALSPEQQTYLREALGDRIFSSVTEAFTPGSNKQLSEETNRFIQERLSNMSAGLTDYTSLQNLAHMNEVFENMDNILNGTYNRDVADVYMSQWGNWNQYVDLLSSDTLNDAQKERLATLRQEFENIRNSAEIDVKVENVKALEEAGKVAEGTAAAFEKLAKGGKDAAEALNSIRKQAFEAGQQRQALYNGTEYQQMQATIAELGISESQFLSNPSRYITYAMSQDRINHDAVVAGYLQEYKAATSDEDRQAIREAAAMEGVRITEPDRYLSPEYFNERRSSLQAPEATDMLDYVAALFGYEYDTELKKYVNNGVSGVYDASLLQEVTPSVGNAFKYANARYVDTNKAGYAADELYKRLNNGTITNFEQLADVINGGSIKDIEDLIMSSEPLVKLFKDLGATANGDTLDFSNVTLEGEALTSAFDALIQVVGAASTEFNNLNAVMSTGKIAETANLYFSGGGQETDFDAFSSYVGNSDLAQAVRNWRKNKNGAETFYDTFTEDNDPYGLNKLYTEMMMDNAAMGMPSELTDVQRYQGLMAILNGDISKARNKSLYGMYGAFTQGVDSNWLRATEALQSEGLGWNVVTKENYENLPDTFKAIYGSFEKATAANEEFNQSLIETGNSLKTSGKYSNEYSQGLQMSSKDLKTSTNALKQYRNALRDASNRKYLREEFQKGNKTAQGLKEYVTSLGFSEKDLKDANMQQQILDAMFAEENIDKAAVSNTLDGFIDGVTQEINAYANSHEIFVNGLQIGVGSGDVNISTEELLAKFGEALNETQRQAIEEALAMGVQINWNVAWDGDQTRITPTVSDFTGKRGGGGGGGGGKSKADKLLEAQKHRIEAIQHENNMLEIEAEDYARANNVTAYESTVDRQIEGQEKLRAAYRQNVSEIKQMMSNVKEGSDEWYKLVEALYSAEEAYAKVASAIDDLIKKQIQERQQLYEFETANNTHAKNMLDIWSKRYSRFNNYNSMNRNIDEQVANARAQLATDTAWANDLAAKIQDQYDRGNNDTDTVREWRQTLDQLIERIANSTEEIAELEASRLSVIQQQRTNNLQTPEHVSRMYDINREMMTLDNNYSGLINAFDKEYSNVYEQYQIWANSREQSLGLLATQNFDTAEWYNTRSDLYEADEQLRQLELQMKQIQNNRIAEQLNYFTKRSDYESGNRQHNLNMIQSEQNRYQSLNELTNYGYMLEKEQEVRQQNIDAAEEELVLLNRTKDALEEQGLAGTENYLNVIELIKQREELIRSETATIEENTKKLKENQEAILKTRKDLEDTLDAEFKAREEQRKKELSARVSLENTILETIKDRYRDEWRLIQEDINKKREALAKEKALISERLNARKQAASQEEKYSELEEYQRQLAMIANDPTRSKDAAQLRARIAELQKALSWEEATQEAQASMETIDQEMAALAEEETTGSNQLSEMLADANNFSEEVENIINGSWDTISAYLTENNKAFKNSLEDGQQQMLEGWEQTWKNMMGIVDTYWEEINEILTSPESFLAYMMASRTFTNASEIGQELLVIAWQNMMDRYISANKSSPEAENYQTDTHPWYEGSGEYGDVDTYSGIGVNGTWGTPENGVNMPVDNGQIIFPEQPSAGDASASSSGSGGGQGNYYRVWQPGTSYRDVWASSEKEAITRVFGSNPVGDVYVATALSKTAKGVTKWSPYNKHHYKGWHNSLAPTIAYATESLARDYPIGVEDGSGTGVISFYKNGGIVDFTGPAWVDGTPSKPEAFLNASQTETFKKLADAMTKISISGGIWPDGDMFSGGDTNYGDIYVTINQAELKDDADFDEVAKKVGKSFVKEMSRNGFNLTKYNL